jgi:hypothetical protein
MTREQFRRMALSLPRAVEGQHMNHPDFRVEGKIFATLSYPDEKWGMVKLTPQEQQEFLREQPSMFESVTGAWGRLVNVVPRQLAREFEAQFE